jgi:hypothetical protein
VDAESKGGKLAIDHPLLSMKEKLFACMVKLDS